MANNPQAFAVRRDVRLSPTSIQEMLDENVRLIHSLMAHQKCGAVKEAAELQQILHRNLIYLATIADRTAAHLNPSAPVPAQNPMQHTPHPAMLSGHTQAAAPPVGHSAAAPHPMPSMPNQPTEMRTAEYLPATSSNDSGSGAPSCAGNPPGHFYPIVQFSAPTNGNEVQSKEFENAQCPTTTQNTS